MAVKIGSNVASLTAQRRLGEAASTLEKSYERLSSGQRINRASDDAASLAISQSLGTRSRVLGQAIRNLNDGLSVINIQNSAVRELSVVTMRQAELSEQAANGSYSSEQRAALQTEISRLNDEYNRIVRSTRFNGLSLLDGSATRIEIQAGAGGNDAILGIDRPVLGAAAVIPGPNLANGGMGEATHDEILMPGAFGFSVASGDLDEDGDIDLVEHLNATPSSQAYIKLNDGNGVLTGVQSYTLGNFHLGHVEVTDVNGDSKLDIIGSSNRISILLGNGDGTFISGATYSTPTTPQLTMEDLNGDGKTDIVTTDSSTKKVGVYLNNGNGTFADAVLYSAGSTVGATTAADFNGDGAIDIAVTNGSSNTFSILTNTGDGTFGAGAVYTTITTATGIVADDLNGDGSIDIVVNGGNQSRIFANDGEGTFSLAASYSGVNSSLFLGDFNADNKLDIATSYSIRGLILFNQGNFSFEKGPVLDDCIVDPMDVLAADFSGDGALDLAYVGFIGANPFFHFTSIMLGTTEPGPAANVVNDLTPLDVTSPETARQSLMTARERLSYLTEVLSNLGATQSRLEAALQVVLGTRESIDSANARITDLDIAQETASLTKSRILQQVGTSILSQANQTPQIALSLLREA